MGKNISVVVHFSGGGTLIHEFNGISEEKVAQIKAAYEQIGNGLSLTLAWQGETIYLNSDLVAGYNFRVFDAR